MKCRSPLSPALALAVALALPVVLAAPSAEAQSVGVGARVGTTGYGPELTFPLTRTLGGRVAVGLGTYDFDFDTDVASYEGEVEMSNALVVADLFPSGGGFRVSLGALVNDNQLRGDAPTTDLLREADVVIPPPFDTIALGRVHAEVEVEPIAPYVGIGFGRGPQRDGGFHVAFDLGVAYQGEPEVDLTYQGLPAALGSVLPDELERLIELALAEESRRLSEEVEDYQYFPVVALTLGYRF